MESNFIEDYFDTLKANDETLDKRSFIYTILADDNIMATLINGAFPIELLEPIVSKSYLLKRYNDLNEKGLIHFGKGR